MPRAFCGKRTEEDGVVRLTRAALLRGALGAALAARLPASAFGAPKPSPFVTRQGTGYVSAGRPWILHGASIYHTSNPGGSGTISDTIAMALNGRLNTLRIVNFFDEGSTTSPTDPAVAPYSASDWARVDAIIDAASRNGLKVILDLSAFRNCLQNWSVNRGLTTTPYSQFAHWQRFIRFAAKRVNSVNGVPYKRDPTIAFVSFAGEPNPPRSGEPPKPTTAELTEFYRWAFAEWRQHDRDHLLSSGGLLHIDWEEAFGDPNGSGIDWRAIFALRDNDVPSVHNYWHELPPTAANDYRSPKVSAYCASIGKPWITEEFGFTQAPEFGGTTYTEADRGDWYGRVYAIQRSRGSSGAAFWNLGREISPASHDASPATPATWTAVQANAPS